MSVSVTLRFALFTFVCSSLSHSRDVCRCGKDDYKMNVLLQGFVSQYQTELEALNQKGQEMSTMYSTLLVRDLSVCIAILIFPSRYKLSLHHWLLPSNCSHTVVVPNEVVVAIAVASIEAHANKCRDSSSMQE